MIVCIFISTATMVEMKKRTFEIFCWSSKERCMLSRDYDRN